MTREEKIELLNKLLEIEEKNDIGNLTRAERGEFQQLVNDVIDQESCDKCVYSTKDGYCQYDDITETIPPFEPCEDAISRQAVLNILLKYSLGESRIAEELKDLPAVTPQPKVGHWIIYDVHGHKACKCSGCSMDVGYPCNDKFCRYCGAKMEGNEE